MSQPIEVPTGLKLGIVHRNRLVREACKRAVRSIDIEVVFAVDSLAAAENPRTADGAHCLLIEASQTGEQTKFLADWVAYASVLLFHDLNAVDLSYTAIQNGALGTIEAPVLTDSGDIEGKAHFVETLQRFGRSIGVRLGKPLGAAPLIQAEASAQVTVSALPSIIALGASTGGPNALAQILRGLPHDLPAAVLVVQHIEQDFTQGLAEWLGEHTVFGVRVAERGSVILPGHVYLAPPNRHLVLDERGRIAHRIGESHELHTPSIDVLFESLSKHAKPGLAALLTGMGRDGAAGLLRLKKSGWHTIAQDEASSAVYGMPRAAVEIGAESQSLKLSAIAGALVRHVLTQART